jgi:hypothetical protein
MAPHGAGAAVDEELHDGGVLSLDGSQQGPQAHLVPSIDVAPFCRFMNDISRGQ